MEVSVIPKNEMERVLCYSCHDQIAKTDSQTNDRQMDI